MEYKLIVENIRLPYYEDEKVAIEMAKKTISQIDFVGDISNVAVHKKSIDARHKDNISFVYSIIATVSSNKDLETSVLKRSDVKIYSARDLELSIGNEKMKNRIVVVGFGPAGIFASLLLAKYGYKPLVLERGSSIENRVKTVDSFLNGEKLDLNTNIQFGAGGAGTFSDGKLTTRISDYRCEYVTKEFVSLGAPEDILYKSKPHIGSDILRDVVFNADKKIKEYGGEIRYNSIVSEIYDNYLTCNGERILFDACILAIGHSSRDTYKFLLNNDFVIEAKPFSVGVRCEHLQKDIDIATYGKLAGKYGLETADYSLSYRKGNRGAYSFCMCPGGVVIAAASEENGVVTNGMSYRARNSKNANAAIAVSVLPEDFDNSPIKAIEFQRNLESKAFNLAGGTYAAPCQLLGDFYNNTVKNEPKRILPTYRNGDVKMANLNSILPNFVTSYIKEGFANFAKKLKGFDSPDVPLTGVETRTSAPIRILRGENFNAINHTSIYPCGEGAGYAGGIMSAAVDGIKVAEAIISKYKAE